MLLACRALLASTRAWSPSPCLKTWALSHRGEAEWHTSAVPERCVLNLALHILCVLLAILDSV